MLLRYTVALMGTLMMLGVAAHAWRMRSPALGYLAAWFATLAGVAASRAIGQQPGLWVIEAWNAPAILFNLLAGPLMLNYVHHSLRGRAALWWVYAPVATLALLALAFGPLVVIAFGLPRSLLVEAVYTALCVLLYLQAWRDSSPRVLPVPAVGGVLIALLSIHLGQLLQVTFGANSHPLVYYAVVIIIGCWLFVGLLILLTQSPGVRNFVPALRTGPNAQEQDHFARIEAAMREHRPWRDGDFEVAQLAELVGLTANQVSRALVRAGDTSFFDYVNLHRVREAERLLLDPNEARFKVEALGRQAGFRSRSTFFKLFRAHTGLTPAEYRAARSAPPPADSSPSAP